MKSLDKYINEGFFGNISSGYKDLQRIFETDFLVNLSKVKNYDDFDSIFYKDIYPVYNEYLKDHILNVYVEYGNKKRKWTITQSNDIGHLFFAKFELKYNRRLNKDVYVRISSEMRYGVNIWAELANMHAMRPYPKISIELV